MRRYGYGYQGTWHLTARLTTIKNPYRLQTDIPFTSKEFSESCENLYARFGQNPLSTDWLLLQYEPNTPHTATVLRLDMASLMKKKGWTLRSRWDAKESADIIVPVYVPRLDPVLSISGDQDSTGNIVLQGQTKNGQPKIGRPLCTIELTPKKNCSQHYVFYSMQPHTWKPPIHIRRFKNSIDAKKLQNEKGGCQKSGELEIKNNDVPKRIAIVTREPDQNTVMGLPAVEEYRNRATQYQDYLNPHITKMLLHSSKIMHLSTLRSKDEHKEKVSNKIRNIAHRDRLLRTEWLHLLSYGLHPMCKDPQYPGNLASARACDNTRMMLLEYTARWFALNVPSSKNRLSAQFDLLLDTNIIDTITLLTMICIDGIQCKLTQKIDALRLNPEYLPASDLAGLIATLTLLIQGQKPVVQEIIKITPCALDPRKSSNLFFAMPAIIDDKIMRDAQIHGARPTGMSF